MHIKIFMLNLYNYIPQEKNLHEHAYMKPQHKLYKTTIKYLK